MLKNLDEEKKQANKNVYLPENKSKMALLNLAQQREAIIPEF